MSFTVQRYRPAFAQGFDDKPVTVERVEQICNLDYIKEHSASPGFYRFTVDLGKNCYYLLAEYEQGKEWHVIASIAADPGNAANMHEIAITFPRFDPPPTIPQTHDAASGKRFYTSPKMHPEYKELSTPNGDITTIRMPDGKAESILGLVEGAFNGNLTLLRRHALSLFGSEGIDQAAANTQYNGEPDLVARQKLRANSAEISLLNNYFALKKDMEWDLDDPLFAPGMRLRLRPAGNYVAPAGSGYPELLVIRSFHMSEAVKETIATYALHPIDEQRATGWNALTLWDRYVKVVNHLEASGYVVKAVPALTVNVMEFLSDV